MIELNIDQAATNQGLSTVEVFDRIGLGEAQREKIKRNEVSAIRYSTLDSLCRVLDCEPGDLLFFRP